MRRSLLLACLVGFAVLVGCGGGSSTADAGTPTGPVAEGVDPLLGLTGPGDATDAIATARFHVDVPSGEVTVSPVAGAPADSRAVFTGSAVDFESSTLIDQPGSNGLKVLSVKVVNRWGLPIGRQPDGTVTGLRVVFGPFTNVNGPALDVRRKATVTTLATGLASPWGTAAGPGGAVYVTCLTGHQVKKIDHGSVSVLAGRGTPGYGDGIGLTPLFNGPMGIAYSPTDQCLYVTEHFGRRLRRVTLDGSVTTVAGTGAEADADGPGTTASFRKPTGVAVGADGAVYVSDSEAGRIRKVVLTGGDPRSPANWRVSTAATSLMEPYGLAIGPDGWLYAAALTANRVVGVAPTGGATSLAGSGTKGGANGRGDAAQFSNPCGLAWLHGDLVVVDHSMSRIRLMHLAEGGSQADPASWWVGSLAGSDAGSRGSFDGDGLAARFSGPVLASSDEAGNVYLADRDNGAVRRITLPAGQFGGPVGGSSSQAEPVQLSNATGLRPGTGGAAVPFIDYQWFELTTPGRSVLDPGEASPAQLWSFVVPEGVRGFEFDVTVEADTPVLVPVEAGSGAGSNGAMVTTVAGSVVGHRGFIDGIGTQARFHCALPEVDRFGNMYVADRFNRAIRRIDTSGRVRTIAGVPSGTAEFVEGTADGSGYQARFRQPAGLAVTPDGEVLYVADWGAHTIRRLALTRGADPNAPGSWRVATIAGAADAVAYADGVGDAARFNQPTDVALSPDGQVLYVVESYGQRLRRLRFKGGDAMVAANWDVSTVAGHTGAAIGDTGTADGGTIAARFNAPTAVAADQAGNVYIADRMNHRIRRVDPDGLVTTLAGPGPATAPVAGYVDGTGTAARFDDPMGIAVDAAGYVYVADLDNHRIRRISPTGVVTTVAGTGTPGDADGPGNTAAFRAPWSVAVDPAGNLFVGDGQVDPLSAGPTRIRKIQRIISAGGR